MSVELVKGMLAGDVLPLARLISLVEKDGAEVAEVMRLIYPHVGKAYRVGITGPPGAGKSTIVDKLTGVMRGEGLTVGIVCADPTSPFSGGAILGDRIRMAQHYLDEGVFIRSMATRGSLGGLPRTVGGVIKLLDVSGKDFILVETVGVGQTELDIMASVDTVVVVLVPEAGDTVQTMKAGLFEIADIFVVNKADRPGAKELALELKMMLQLDKREPFWEVPVLLTEAVNNSGIEELYEAIEKHRRKLEESGKLEMKRRDQRKQEFIEVMKRKLVASLWSELGRNKEISAFLEKVERGELDPYSAAQEILSSGIIPEKL